MSAPRLAGPAVALVPVADGVPAAVQAGDPVALGAALAAAGLTAGEGWPHDDTPDALGPMLQPEGTWLVVVDGEVVGDCGWAGPRQDDGGQEIGYGLAEPARGRGIGTEAVALLAAWTEQQPGVRLVTAEVLTDNTPSLRLLGRLGFVEQGSRAPYVRLVRAAAGAPRPRGRHVC